MGLIDIKSATITEKGQIAIPKALRDKAGFKEGSKIAILNYDDHIELRKMNEIEERFGCAFASEKSLGKAWNTKEEGKRWKNLQYQATAHRFVLIHFWLRLRNLLVRRRLASR